MKTLKKFAAIVMRPFERDDTPAPEGGTNTPPAPTKLSSTKKRSQAKKRRR